MMTADDMKIIKQLVSDAKKTQYNKVFVPEAKKRKTRRFDRFDEATTARIELNVAKLNEAREKREKTKRRTDDPARDLVDGRRKDNSEDVQFVANLHKRLEETGWLEKALTKAELV